MSNSRFAPVLVTLPLLLCGCAKFKSSRRVDFGPFAEQTIATISQLDLGLTKRRGVLLREYAEHISTEFEDTRVEIQRIDDLLELITGYSVRIVTIARTGRSGAEMAEMLADEFELLSRSTVFAGLTGGAYSFEFQAILTQIRAQDSFLAGLGAAQPLINAMGRFAADTAISIRADAEAVILEVGDKLEERWAETARFERLLLDQKDEVMVGLAQLDAYHRGDEGALQALLDSTALTAQERDEANGDPRALEALLRSRLTSLAKSTADIAPERALYVARMQELYSILDDFDSNLREAWGVIFVWTRAHDRMARGVVDPAAWFDLTDAPGTVFRLAGGAI